MKLEGGEVLVNLEKVLCVPDLADNLLSVNSMTMHGARCMVLLIMVHVKSVQEIRCLVLVTSMSVFME